MKVAYLFTSPVAVCLHFTGNLISKLESGKLKLEVVGMCFFDDNALILDIAQVLGLKIHQFSNDMNILLMTSSLAPPPGKKNEEQTQSGTPTTQYSLTPAQRPVITIFNRQETACFPDIYSALSANRPDRLISV